MLFLSLFHTLNFSHKEGGTDLSNGAAFLCPDTQTRQFSASCWAGKQQSTWRFLGSLVSTNSCFSITVNVGYEIQGWAKERSLGCVNSPPRPEGVRRRDSRNLGTTLLPSPVVVTQSLAHESRHSKIGVDNDFLRGVRKTERRAELAEEAVTS